MHSKVEIEDAIDALRRNASQSALANIIGAMAQGKARLTTRELSDVMDATILAVIQKFRKAESTPEIARKLWTIVEHKVADLIKRQVKERRFSTDADPDLEASSQFDPAQMVARCDSFEELIADLKWIRAQNARYFEVICALIDREPIAARLERVYGTPVSKDTAYQLKHRALEMLETKMQKRKEEVL